MPMPKMTRALLLFLAVMSAAGALLFALAYYDRYWRWRDCFNELGRCYDPQSQQVFLEQAGVVWGSFTTACFFLCALLLWRALRWR